MATREEETVVLQQFLRFGETKTIAQEIILQDTKDRHEALIKQTPRTESDIKKFIERSNLSMQNYIKSYESTRQLFGSRSVPFIPPTNRIIASPLVPPSYSPGREPRGLSLPQTPAASSTPLTTPALSRVQVLQPFDARKEQPSPVVSLGPGSLDKSVLRRSPLCDSPKNLSTTPTVISSASTSPSHQIILQPQHPQDQVDVDGVDPYPSGSEEEGEALDYSTKDTLGSLAEGDKKGKQHMRKSTNPIKRQWTPSANFGSTFVGPNGKKRVLCTACNKTFCDKGALKIHYSAVHLKEMHKCTVEGCNMMFSSRRSRNRHSANPNPKLHMPQKRKDELDQSEEMDLSTSNGAVTPVSTSAVPIAASSPVPPIPTLPKLDSPCIIRSDSNFFIEMSAQFPFMTPPEKRIKLEDEQPTDLSKLTVTSTSDEEPCDLSKKFDGELKLEIDLDASSNEKEDLRADEEGEMDENGGRNESGVRGGKRRKNTAPTRCAQSGNSQAARVDSSHDKDQAARVDNSDDKDPNERTSAVLNKNGVLTCTVRTPPDADNGASSFHRNDDENKRSSMLEHSSHEEDDGGVQDVAAFSQISQEKRQEGTEARNFPKIASLLWASGLHATGNTEKARKEDGSQDLEEDAARNEEVIPDEVPDADEDDISGRDSSEENESLPSSDILRDYPAEVYVDHENPLKCKICGKVFQNSFTVKIHFQNVHLKVMHPCTVDGCSATFPSKRSRDRHSANLNLHCRILAVDSNAGREMDDTLRGDILAKLYGRDLIGANVIAKVVANDGDNENKHVNNNNNEEVKGPEDQQFHTMNNGKVTNISTNSSLKMTIQHSLHGHVSKPGSTGSEAISDESDGEGEAMSKEEEYIENQSLKIPCKLCGDKFSTSAVLQEHISISHTEHDLTSPAPTLKKTVSPRRIRSRQKTRNSMTTRKSSSL